MSEEKTNSYMGETIAQHSPSVNPSLSNIIDGQHSTAENFSRLESIALEILNRLEGGANKGMETGGVDPIPAGMLDTLELLNGNLAERMNNTFEILLRINNRL